MSGERLSINCEPEQKEKKTNSDIERKLFALDFGQCCICTTELSKY